MGDICMTKYRQPSQNKDTGPQKYFNQDLHSHQATQNKMKKSGIETQPAADQNPAYFSNQAVLNSPYQNPNQHRKIQKKSFFDKRKQVVINKGNQKSIILINPEATLQQTRNQCNLLKNLKFLKAINSKFYFVEGESEKKLKIKEIWYEVQDQHQVLMKKYEVDAEKTDYLSEEDKNVRKYYQSEIDKIKQKSLLIVVRNSLSSVIYIDSSISLMMARVALKLGTLEYFYQYKMGELLPIEKNFQENITIKDARGKDENGNSVLIIRLRNYNFEDGNYIGEVSQGLKHGRGWLVYHQQDKKQRVQYNGHWEDGKRSNRGKLRWKNGDQYDGEWENDRPSIGKIQFANGKTFQGDLRQKISSNDFMQSILQNF